MASQWHVRNTLPAPWLASAVPPHSKVSNWMPKPPEERNTNKYTKWIQGPNGSSTLAPINRSGWNTPKPKKGWLWGGKTRGRRKARKYRNTRKYRR